MKINELTSNVFNSAADNIIVIKELATKVYNYAQTKKEGFTLNIRTLQPVTSGIVASYEATQDSFSETDLQSVIKHALCNDGVVGGWFNPENGKYYFDSNKIFDSKDRDSAIVFGLKNKQKALFDLDNNKPIELNTQSSTAKKFNFSTFADWMLDVVTQVVKYYKGDVLIDSYKIIGLRNEQLFGSQSTEPQSFSFYWGVRETGTWLYHIEGHNLFTVKELMQGLGAEKVYFIKFDYDNSKNEKITVHEIDKIIIYN